MQINTQEIMIDELFVRFFTDVTLYNTDMAKCFWQLEKMYWYYLDVTKVKEKPTEDGMKMFINNNYVRDYLLCILPEDIDIDAEFEKFIENRKTIPRCKVVLLDSEMENMLLTKGVYDDYFIFPGGKLDESDTNLMETAIRETYKEIGFDISDKINCNLYFDLTENGIQNRYFVISNIDKNTNFCSNVLNKVQYIKWFPIRDFPDNVGIHYLRTNNVKEIKLSVHALMYIADVHKTNLCLLLKIFSLF